MQLQQGLPRSRLLERVYLRVGLAGEIASE
jgi:hypothetical protein